MPPFLHAFHSRLKESPGQSSLNFPKSLANFQRALWKTDENGHQRDLLALKFSVRNFPRNFSTREVTLEKRLRSSTSSEDRRSWRAFFTEISNQVRLNREFDLNYFQPFGPLRIWLHTKFVITLFVASLNASMPTRASVVYDRSTRSGLS